MDKPAHWAVEYLSAPYIDGGRTLAVLDCWGLVRDVLHRRFNLPVLASFGNVHPDDKQELTASFNQVVIDFVPGMAQPGAVASGFRGNNLIHVGVCIGEASQLKILHTSRRHGAMLSSVREFKRLFPTVIFYVYDSDSRDPRLPQ